MKFVNVRLWHKADVVECPIACLLLGAKQTFASLGGMIRISTIGDLIESDQGSVLLGLLTMGPNEPFCDPGH